MEAFLSDNISFFDYNLQQYYFQDPIITLEICDTIKTTTYAINYILSVDIDDSEIYKYDPDMVTTIMNQSARYLYIIEKKNSTIKSYLYAK